MNLYDTSAGTPTKTPELITVGERLHKAIEELSMEIDGLDVRLQEVLVPASPLERTKEEVKDGIHSPSVSNLMSCVRKIDFLIKRVADLKSRLET